METTDITLKTREQAARDGDTHYFSGKKCKRGHDSGRYVSSGGCIDCLTITVKRYNRKLRKVHREGRAQSSATTAEQAGG